jgi:hypothetical protein
VAFGRTRALPLRVRPLILMVVIAVVWVPAPGMSPTVASIIGHFLEANRRDWQAAPAFSFSETDREGRQTKTYDVTMMSGSPYSRLTELNGEPLSNGTQQREQIKAEHELIRREKESQQERAHRVAQYESERKRDHLLMQGLTKAMDFKISGQENIAGHEANMLDATPRRGYHPPNVECSILAGMQGQLWIDKATYQWIKVEANVVHPVSIGGFIARVSPGTRFELENIPVTADVWPPRHFAVKSHTKILFVLGHSKSEEETYFAYRPSETAGNRGLRNHW